MSAAPEVPIPTASAPSTPAGPPGRDTRATTQLAPGVRQQLPVVALVGALSVLVGLIAIPHQAVLEVCLAGALFMLLVVAVLALPWPRLPRWSWLLVPVGYMAVIAMLRDAQGGSASGMGIVFLVPIVWIAFYGNRAELLAGLAAVAAALLVPVWLIGAPGYPQSSWRGVAELLAISALIAFAVYNLVARERAHVRNLATQTELARQAARQADEASRQLSSILAAATRFAVIGIDDRARVFFFSTGAEQLLGYSADEVVGRMAGDRLLDLDDPERPPPNGNGAASSFHPALDRELVWTCRRKDGRPVRLSATFSAWAADIEGGRSSGYVVVASDVTRREQLESERERTLAVQREVTQVLVEQNQHLSELSTMKDDVVATVSHELRTPLTSIKGFVDLLLDDDGPHLDDEQVRMLRAIERNAEQLLKVSEDLLADPGRGRELHVTFVDVDLSVLAVEAVDAMAASAIDHGVALAAGSSGPAMVHGDPHRLHQLLGNLLSNAVKFTPSGGRVVVRVDGSGPSVLLRVHDTGHGIPKAEREHLFERFYRLAAASELGIPGSGLGLAIAKSVVEAHSGTIEIVDVPGWSTTFEVRLPSVSLRAHPSSAPLDLSARGPAGGGDAHRPNGAGAGDRAAPAGGNGRAGHPLSISRPASLGAPGRPVPSEQ
ncbi:MAG: ATP-binding protein [Acidimicrobiales bacterium]